MSTWARSFAFLAAACAGCTAPEPEADAATLATTLAGGSGPIEFVLPDSVQAWRASLEADASALENLLGGALQRWPQVEPERPTGLRLVLAPSPVHAAALAEEWGLRGDAHVPRTHLGARLAIVPMPRIDRLLTERDLPPRTLRETIRHEMAHLLAMDRPSLSAAPRWFQEGIAEAWVGLLPADGLTARTHAMGSSWRRALAARLESTDPNRPFMERLSEVPAELRYTAWADLATRCMAQDRGEKPWLAIDKILEEFERPFARNASAGSDLPRVLGREIDFSPGSRSVLLVSPADQVVALEACHWNGVQPWQMRARVGRTGAGHAEIVLGDGQSGDCVRIRMNANGGIVAGWETRMDPPKRAFRDRFPMGSLQSWRELELRVVPRVLVRHARPDPSHPNLLLVRSGEYEARLDLPAGCEPRPGAPWELRFSVRDGAFEVIADRALVAALR